MSSPGQIAEEPKLNIFVEFNNIQIPVANAYYTIRERAEDGGKTLFRRIDCRHHYQGNFKDVYLEIDDKWFRIDCFGPLKENGYSGTIIHQSIDLIQLGVEYFPNTNRSGKNIAVGNQGNQ